VQPLHRFKASRPFQYQIISEMLMGDTSNRLRIGVLFGGRSAEHDVSVLSATNVMRALDLGKYEAVPVFVTRQGQWC